MNILNKAIVLVLNPLTRSQRKKNGYCRFVLSSRQISTNNKKEPAEGSGTSVSSTPLLNSRFDDAHR
jgi:hypothetical protein